MKLFPQFFAFLFFISIQFKVQHVNSTAKVGISPETAKLSAIFLPLETFKFPGKYVETILSIYYPCARS